jgi:hypothetical protein
VLNLEALAWWAPTNAAAAGCGVWLPVPLAPRLAAGAMRSDSRPIDCKGGPGGGKRPGSSSRHCNRSHCRRQHAQELHSAHRAAGRSPRRPIDVAAWQCAKQPERYRMPAWL